MTSSPVCNLHQHGRELPPAPRCEICSAPPVVRRCDCCHATCLVPPCSHEHRGGKPTTIDIARDGQSYCDDCAVDCPAIKCPPAAAAPARIEGIAAEQLDLFGVTS